MEGPTPVSVLFTQQPWLLLSFFLIARTSFIYEHAPNILEFITILGAATAFLHQVLV
jgi:NADH:ubiquinone oxidoreductase subunit 5 (subunit L)/multisubunit Na+/H+ antiporter MnhA subunit